jgi:glycosyltransferase involved in cell wall biosynthesis
MKGNVQFWSSTQETNFLPALVCALGEMGWEARARFSVTEAEYRRPAGSLARIALRARAYLLYPLKLAAALRSGRQPDVVVVNTNTFYAPFFAQRSGSPGAPSVIHWVFDLFPDVLVLAGKLKEGSLAERCLRRWVSATFDRAAVNVFLGERLRAHAEARFGPIPRSVVVPVGCDAAPFCNSPPGFWRNESPLRILYCGNLGRMHDIETILGALCLGIPEGVELEFRGAGAGFRSLAEAVGAQDLGAGVKLGGSLAKDEWVRAMLRAEVALVTMRKGAEGLVMPSKAYSAMASGQALLAVCPTSSDLADAIRFSDCGWIVEPGDAAGLRRAILEILSLPEELLRRRRNAWKAGQELYDQRVLAKSWVGILEGARAAAPAAAKRSVAA